MRTATPGTATADSRLKTTTSRCLGIRVVYDEKMEGISDSRGLWPCKRIFVGPKFFAFPPREQQALLLHEAGHCKLRHLERRLLAALLFFSRPAKILELCKAQEFEADRFASLCGFGPDLARAFLRLSAVSASPFHPPIAERVARLLS